MRDEVNAKRNRDIALGDVGRALPRAPKRQRLQHAASFPALPMTAGSNIMVSFVMATHNQIMQRALHDEAMRCFNLIGLSGQIRLLHDNNANAFPGMQNLGNTCWLNVLIQCVLHVSPLRHIISAQDANSTDIRRALRRIACDYWVLGSRGVRHSIMVPVDILHA